MAPSIFAAKPSRKSNRAASSISHDANNKWFSNAIMTDRNPRARLHRVSRLGRCCLRGWIRLIVNRLQIITIKVGICKLKRLVYSKNSLIVIT
jgi:hypothetical protein